MPKQDDLFTARKNLGEICTVPDKIISVYSLEKHVWAESNSDAARKARKPELKTIQDDRILLLLPGMRSGGRTVLFPSWEGTEYSLPTNLIAADHLWEIKE